MKLSVLLVPLLALTACATVPPSNAAGGSSGLRWARLGEAVSVDGPTVTPLRLVEDSRCPQGVQCVWAGRVVVSATISTPTMKLNRDLTLGEPFALADGTLTLADVRPGRARDTATPPADYRFGFRFDSED